MPVLWRRDPGSSQEVQALRGMDGRQTTVSQIKWNGETAGKAAGREGYQVYPLLHN